MKSQYKYLIFNIKEGQSNNQIEHKRKGIETIEDGDSSEESEMYEGGGLCNSCCADKSDNKNERNMAHPEEEK